LDDDSVDPSDNLKSHRFSPLLASMRQLQVTGDDYRGVKMDAPTISAVRQLMPRKS
jgi:hypothetical protein